MTRRRWDRIFIPALAVFVAASAWCYWVSDRIEIVFAPSMLIPFWLWMRYTTPKCGMPALTISSTPGMPQMMMLGAIITFMMFAGCLTESLVFGRRGDDPMEWRDAAWFVPTMIVL